MRQYTGLVYAVSTIWISIHYLPLDLSVNLCYTNLITSKEKKMKFLKIIRAVICTKDDIPIEEIRECVKAHSQGQVQVPDTPDEIKGGTKLWDIRLDKNQHP